MNRRNLFAGLAALIASAPFFSKADAAEKARLMDLYDSIPPLDPFASSHTAARGVFVANDVVVFYLDRDGYHQIGTLPGDRRK